MGIETESGTNAPAAATTANLGFLLTKASARWNQLLAAAFSARGFSEVRPAYGSILLPLFEQDGLRIGELGERARLPKQTMTTLIRQMERDGLVARGHDSRDGRVSRIHLTRRAKRFRAVAEDVLADLDARVAEHLSRRTTEEMRRALATLIDVA
jgi:DNA-binding MarR family transcriptional regulator